jgi:hypothetical protein
MVSTTPVTAMLAQEGHVHAAHEDRLPRGEQQCRVDLTGYCHGVPRRTSAPPAAIARNIGFTRVGSHQHG